MYVVYSFFLLLSPICVNMEYQIIALKVCLVFTIFFLYLNNSDTRNTESRNYNSDSFYYSYFRNFILRSFLFQLDTLASYPFDAEWRIHCVAQC
jgi:hypothetical protein